MSATHEVMDILANKKTDLKKIALELAKQDPETFLKCYKSMSNWKSKVIEALKEGDRVRAIQIYRTINKTSTLLEAKEEVDHVQAEEGIVDQSNITT